jgi:hypothetical protein
MFFFGDNYYGLVDRVPALFYVRTRFHHIWFVSLVPRESYLFFDDQPDHQLVGIRIPLSWKSILAGWVRGLLVFFAVLVFCSGLVVFESEQMRLAEKLRISGICSGLALLACVGYWFTLRLFRPSIERAYALGICLGIPRLVIKEYYLGNKAGFWSQVSKPDLTPQGLEAPEKEAIRAAIEKKKADGEFLTIIKDGQK